ncbi:PD-(D/E)XK nuclease family protein [Streptomyces sp. Mo3]|uniref:PD-(D/E)XK nuclease family protein n=1 Tax=Streptomyces sp. Mo3 TaxID=3161190 RepID=UPI0039EF1E70
METIVTTLAIAPKRPVSLWPAAHAADARRPRSQQTKLGASDTVCARRAGYLLHGRTPTDTGEKRKAILGTWLHDGMLDAAREEYGWLVERRVEDETVRGHIDAVQLNSTIAARLPKRLRPTLPAEETTVEDVKSKSTYQWDSIVRYGASEAELRQVYLYADLLGTEGFASVRGQRQLARLGPVPVARIRFRFINRDNGDDHIQEIAYEADRARRARWWVQQVRTAASPEELPRTFQGPGISTICDHCPFRTACWGPLVAGRSPQSQLIHDDEERGRALAEYAEVSKQIKPLKDRQKYLRAQLDGSEPGVYGDNVLKWSGGNPTKVDDVGAMVSLYRRAGLAVPMAPDAAAMKATLEGVGIPVPTRLDHDRRTAVSINVTASKKP